MVVESPAGTTRGAPWIGRAGAAPAVGRPCVDVSLRRGGTGKFAGAVGVVCVVATATGDPSGLVSAAFEPPNQRPRPASQVSCDLTGSGVAADAVTGFVDFASGALAAETAGAFSEAS